MQNSILEQAKVAEQDYMPQFPKKLELWKIANNSQSYAGPVPVAMPFW